MRIAVLVSLCVLVLAACQQSSNTSVTRIRANGVDTLYSKTTVDNGVARFDCIASSTGRSITWCWMRAARRTRTVAIPPCTGWRWRWARPSRWRACQPASSTASVRCRKNNATVNDHGGIVAPPAFQ